MKGNTGFFISRLQVQVNKATSSIIFFQLDAKSFKTLPLNLEALRVERRNLTPRFALSSERRNENIKYLIPSSEN